VPVCQSPVSKAEVSHRKRLRDCVQAAKDALNVYSNCNCEAVKVFIIIALLTIANSDILFTSRDC